MRTKTISLKNKVRLRVKRCNALAAPGSFYGAETKPIEASKTVSRLKSILVPIDFSDLSKKALDFAVPFAERFGAKLTLLHVIEPVGTPDFANTFPLIVQADRLKAMSKAQLELLIKGHAIDPKLIENVLVREGRSFHEIVETARKVESDLIIMPTHGYTGIKHVLLGSTAERVVQHATCPIILLRAREDGSMGTDFTLKKILVPIDFSACSKKALRYAVPLAAVPEAELTVLKVVPPIPYYGQGDGAIAQYGISEPDYARIEAKTRSAVADQLSLLITHEIPASVRATPLVTTGYPANEIIEQAKNWPADLIVISTHGRTGLKHVLVGSVAERVVRHAPCAVLIVREQEHEFAWPTVANGGS